MSNLGRVAAMVTALMVLAACGGGANPRAEPATSTQPGPSPAPTLGELDDIGSASESDDDPDGAAHHPPPPAPRGGAPSEPVEPSVSVEVDAPDGWERTDEPELVAASGGHGMVYLHDEACDDGFCAHLHVAVMPGPVTSLEAYHARSKREVDEVLEADLLTEESAAIDGYDGYQMGYQVDDADGPLRYLQRYALVEQHVVVATFAATPRLLDRWRADAEALLESITIDVDG